VPKLTARALTQRMIDATPLPPSGETALRDGDVRGLVLRLSALGSRSWRFEYRSPVTGKNRAIGLGALSLMDARTIGRGHRAAVAQGRCPAAEAETDLMARQEAQARAVSVGDALDMYEQAVMAHAAKLMSRQKRMRVLRGAVEPLAARGVASLTRGDLMLRLDQIQAASGGVSRNRAQSEIRHFFGWMRDRDIVGAIPLDRVRRGVRETPRERVLNDEEVAATLAATTDRSAYNDLVRTLLHSAMRRNEAASLQPRDLDFEAKTITVRAEVSKTRQARTIPMVDALAPMLRERARGVRRDGYIFGDGSNFEKPFSGFSKRFAALALAATPKGTDRWTLHDLRRTVATRMHEMGVDALVIEDLLGHLTGVRGGIAGIYNRSATLPRQREALEAWSKKLEALTSASVSAVSAVSAMSAVSADTDLVSANIVQLNRKAMCSFS
jgi:integrase